MIQADGRVHVDPEERADFGTYLPACHFAAPGVQTGLDDGFGQPVLCEAHAAAAKPPFERMLHLGHAGPYQLESGRV